MKSQVRDIVVIGAGKVGMTIARLLRAVDDYDVVVADARPATVDLARQAGFEAVVVDASDTDALTRLLAGRDAVVSACGFSVNPAIAKAAVQAGVSYFDLTEDVETTRRVKALAERAQPGQRFMPQCGLAPGFVSIAAYALTRDFDTLDAVRLRTGALPLYPNNTLSYNLTWSTDGLINEYGNPCEAVVDGRRVEVRPLEGLEHITLDGTKYEAFNTSGGVGTLCETLEGRVKTLDYKTVRYPGHRDLIGFLMRDLRFNERRDMLRDVFEFAVPSTLQDTVVVYCTVTGTRGGRSFQSSDSRRVNYGHFLGVEGTAIELATAASLCAVVDLSFEGHPAVDRGFIRQEQVELDAFLANRFGRIYADAEARSTTPCRTPPTPTSQATPADRSIDSATRAAG